MKEREPEKEKIAKGELLYLQFPETENLFAGYGLTTQEESKEFLSGLLMVDRPQPADPQWLREIEKAYGGYQLVPMTRSGERGIACRMQIEPNSQRHLQPVEHPQSAAIKETLEPLLDDPPSPTFIMRWDEETKLWRSTMTAQLELPEELRQVLQSTGYGCFAAESSIGILHLCHAPDEEIEGFSGKPVTSKWQLVKMTTAPLIRLTLTIQDQPEDPYRFESFLNAADEEQAAVLDRLAGQEQLHLTFYGDDLSYRSSTLIPHSEQQWQQLDEMVEEAGRYWEELPVGKRDFDLAKAEYILHFPWPAYDMMP